MKPDLPNWPRLLKDDLAARYCGVSTTTFRKGVGSIWPRPKKIGRRRLWDRLELDAAIENLGEGGADPFLEALNNDQGQAQAR